MPNFFIVGAAKAGTTSVYEYLRQHPDVYLSPIKEPNYFSSDIDPGTFRKEYRRRIAPDSLGYLNRTYRDDIHAVHISHWDEYLRLFADAGGAKAVGEASVSYLYSRTAAALIGQRVPDAKIIVILRNPVDRAYSHYLMDLRMGYTALPFRRAVEQDGKCTRKGWGISHLYIELGCYYEQIRRYLDVFSADRIKIVFYEQLTDPVSLLQEVFRFLDVDATFVPDVSVRHNVERVPKSLMLNYWMKSTWLMRMKKMISKSLYAEARGRFYRAEAFPRMSADDRRYLVAIFQQEIKNLSLLLQRDLSHWMR